MRQPSTKDITDVQVELTAKLFRGLGDPNRLQILECLVEKERNVGELVDLLGAPQGRVSNHLACLRWCGSASPTSSSASTCAARLAPTRSWSRPTPRR